MASVQKAELYNDTGVADGNYQSAAYGADYRRIQFLGFCKTTNAAGTVAVVLEHSPNGSDWFTLATIPTNTGNDAQMIEVTANVFPQIRADITKAGGGTADILVEVYYDSR